MISEPIPFLANIILVANADGKLSTSELGQLESIRIEMKFKKSDYSAAIRLVEQGNYKPTPVGSFADQVKNLELMLRVAYADDALDKTETSLIIEFGKIIGINQNQLDKLRGEVLAFLKQKEKICPSCGVSCEAKARFCSKCGLSFAATDEIVQSEFKVPTSGLVIEFAESTAASFPSALKIAKEREGFQTYQKNKRTWYVAIYHSGDLKDALPLVESLSGIRNRCLYIDGQEKAWDEIFSFAWCAGERAKAYQSLEYCFGNENNQLNLWGCKQANMDWTEWAKWFCYGRWEKTGILGRKIQWRFDKKRIQHELTTNLFRYRFCPYLRMELSEAILKHLPDTVTPDSDPNWGYHQQDEAPGSIKVVVEESIGDSTYTNEYWTNGVYPKGHRVFSDILSKAFRELGGSTVFVSNLLK